MLLDMSIVDAEACALAMTPKEVWSFMLTESSVRLMLASGDSILTAGRRFR
jgi:hypothetical protein